YPVLDAILGISKTMEEGYWPRGRLVFVEPSAIRSIHFVARFPSMEQPRLTNFKHVRKLLQVTEGQSRHLVSDGHSVVGIAAGRMPRGAVAADFHGGHGYISLDDALVCSFADGRFSSSTRRAKLVHIEEILLESALDQNTRHLLFQVVQSVVHHAQENKHGCTIVVDLGLEPLTLAGQHMEVPLDLVADYNLELAKSLARVDGALHIGADLKLHGFGCLLDGRTVPGENRARGARFNSSLRFTAENPDVVAVVVSSDRPASTMQHGVELTAVCEWRPLAGHFMQPPLLEDWVAG
ncbi:MAG: DNA integrity scanning protein DisA nucleotide-binding domain protein, partial [Oceanidesulfovibrio sp.]